MTPELLPQDIQCEFPSGQKIEESTPPAKRRCLTGVSFAFANVTSLGQQVRQWLLTRPRTPMFMVETHLAHEDYQKINQWLMARGFGVLGSPAAESSKGGTHGGHLMIYPAHMHFHFVHKQIIEGCGWYAVQWTFDDAEILMITAYFRTGEGPQGHTNAQLWAGLLSFVTSVVKPVIILGDFNVSPEEFMTTTMSTIMQVQVLATGADYGKHMPTSMTGSVSTSHAPGGWIQTIPRHMLR